MQVRTPGITICKRFTTVRKKLRREKKIPCCLIHLIRQIVEVWTADRVFIFVRITSNARLLKNQLHYRRRRRSEF